MQIPSCKKKTGKAGKTPKSTSKQQAKIHLIYCLQSHSMQNDLEKVTLANRKKENWKKLVRPIILKYMNANHIF